MEQHASAMCANDYRRAPRPGCLCVFSCVWGVRRVHGKQGGTEHKCPREGWCGTGGPKLEALHYAIRFLLGHNCFGAVLYPITMADFTIADVTDAMLDGAAHVACPWPAKAALFALRPLLRVHCWLPEHLRRESGQDK